MSLHERFNFDNNYRNALFQQSNTLTTPGAVVALHDLTGALLDAMQRMSYPLSAVEQAKAVKVYVERGREIRDRVSKYPPRGTVPDNLKGALSAIDSAFEALLAVYREARQAAQNELLREAGL